MTARETMTLTEAAQALGLSWSQAWRLVLKGQLNGKKELSGWVVTQQSVKAEKKRLSASVADSVA